MSDGDLDGTSQATKRGCAPAHSWRWFLIRAAKHVPKGGRSTPQWKTLGASFFAILQAMGQAANEDGTNAFLGVETLMAVGRCSKDTVQKVLVAAEAMCLLRKTANARGGRHPKPATYACTFPLGADTATGAGLDWELALSVLSSSEHDRRLRHKRAKASEHHVTPPARAVNDGHAASRDAAWEEPARVQTASRDEATERHVTAQGESHDAPTRFHHGLHQERADVVQQPQVNDLTPAQGRGNQGLRGDDSRCSADLYERHLATCDRCPREIWCPEGSRLRRYLTQEQTRKRARHLYGRETP